MAWVRRILLTLLVLVATVAVMFAFWPAPNALLVRYAFTGGGERTAEMMNRYVPDGVESRLDLAYGDGDDEVLDLHRPADVDEALPVVLWLHGGGWVGGDKSDVRPYLEILAADGYAVVGANYSLAPEAAYPTPVRQTAEALRWLRSNADRLRLDPSRVVVAGDSAGAQIAAQVAALTTDPAYAREVGIEAPLPADALRGVAVACGAHDPDDLAGGRGVSGHFFTMVLRSYFEGDDEAEAEATIREHVTGAFPSTWITVGNADPLEPSSRNLAARLAELDVDVTTRFYPPDHRPALEHEYQFRLDTTDGQAALASLRAFLDRTLA